MDNTANILTADAPPGSLHPVVRRQFGDCTMILADCLDVLPDVVCDAIITDPPYGIGYIKGTGGKGKHHRRNIEAIEGDDKPFDPAPLLNFGNVLMWGADHYAQRLPRGHWLVWDKLDGMESWDSFSDVEVAWHNQTGAARIYRKLWKGVCRPGQENGDARLHPSQKPIALMQWCIEQAKVPEGGMVCDPYMGSGTTAIACIRTGRKFVGIEKDAKHFETACERVANELAQGVLLPPNDQVSQNRGANGVASE